MVRMRTIPNALAEIRKADPETDLTEYRIRQLILEGKAPAVMAGKKYLVNLDVLFDVLRGDPITEKESPSQRFTIRRVTA